MKADPTTSQSLKKKEEGEKLLPYKQSFPSVL